MLLGVCCGLMRPKKGRENAMFLRDAVHPGERFMAAKRKAHDRLSRKRLELRRGVWGFYTNERGQSSTLCSNRGPGRVSAPLCKSSIPGYIKAL